MRDDFNIADEFAALVAAKVVDILEERGLVMAAPEPKKVATGVCPVKNQQTHPQGPSPQGAHIPFWWLCGSLTEIYRRGHRTVSVPL